MSVQEVVHLLIKTIVKLFQVISIQIIHRFPLLLVECRVNQFQVIVNEVKLAARIKVEVLILNIKLIKTHSAINLNLALVKSKVFN